MSPPGNASPLACCSRGVQKLKQEPDAEKKECRNLDEIGQEKDGYEGQDLCPRIEDEVGPHYASNGAAGTDGWDVRMPINNELWSPRCQTTQKIEAKISNVSQSIFHIVPEDIEEPHVPQEVPEATVQKHKGEKGEHLLTEGEIQCNLWVSIPRRDKPVAIDEVSDPLPLG